MIVIQLNIVFILRHVLEVFTHSAIRRQRTSCSVSSMPRSGLSLTPASTIEGWGSSGNRNFTGWTPSTGCGSECVSRCTSVYTTWHLDTCRHFANLCPAFLVAVTYAQLVVVNWTSPCQSVHIRGTGFCLRRSYILELAAWQSQEC